MSPAQHGCAYRHNLRRSPAARSAIAGHHFAGADAQNATAFEGDGVPHLMRSSRRRRGIARMARPISARMRTIIKAMKPRTKAPMIMKMPARMGWRRIMKKRRCKTAMVKARGPIGRMACAPGCGACAVMALAGALVLAAIAGGLVIGARLASIAPRAQTPKMTPQCDQDQGKRIKPADQPARPWMS